MAERSVPELARETLRQLALNRLPPTPENYTRIYEQEAGQPGPASFPLTQLRRIHALTPAQTPAQKRLREQLGTAIERRDWQALQQAIAAYANAGLQPQTPADKPVELPPPPAIEALPDDLAHQLGRRFETLATLLNPHSEKVQQLHAQLMEALRSPPVDAHSLARRLHEQHYQLSFSVADQLQVQQLLQELLQAMIRHLSQDPDSASWLAPQLDALEKAITPPLAPEPLTAAQRELHNLIQRRLQLQEGISAAQQALRTMLNSFVQHLAQITRSHETLGTQMEEAARQLEGIERLEDAAPLLQQVLEATRTMASGSRVAQAELQALRENADAREAQIRALQQELDEAARRARHDVLTGHLNRLGLGEALDREVARARRYGQPLSVVLLDMDDMSVLNASHGHETGDAALAHLGQLARQTLRPEDVIARHEGQAFALLLPQTPEPSAVQAMQRLLQSLEQSPLPRQPPVPLSFSAGVAQLQGHENGMDVLRRADTAMLQAKERGKRRVAAASGAQWQLDDSGTPVP
ncbi:sensor domain-containing diguanylate cyclase [Delftia sp. PS-11]|uniref:GGDEF domain-containing protein n=1 Tax=Delftia sp. PS-11 TaxID=2767222 RepID=UPI002458863A|nr:diguanylate cyclase [Delftia sp. PS-11]KAJ8745072.1 diguanylate cyclase [Delftia sp. PS-11]